MAINFHRHAGECCHAVHDQQGPEFVGNFAEGSDIRHHAGRGFPVCESYKLDLTALPGPAHVFRIDGPAEWRRNATNRCPCAFGNLRHAVGKHSIDANNCLVTRLQNIDYGCLDSSGTRAEIGNVVWFAVWKTRRNSSWTQL